MAKKVRSDNLTWHAGSVTAADRGCLLGQRGCVVWLTGLSGSGKSTVARALESRLHEAGRLVFVLDGDNVRHGLNSDLGFSAADRDENIRRIGEVAALMAEAGLIVVTAFISPYREGRAGARKAVGPGRFLEVFLDTPLELCEQRDPKGLYRKARSGELEEFTGVDAPYERPESADLSLDTGRQDVGQCVEAMVQLLAERRFLSPPDDDGAGT
ncbi:MAG: adenylyl-sulfate kinase [Planctomycetes bacterium]|nr:adenylyl-sulfate kinase [Planctomycetota bacterium]